MISETVTPAAPPDLRYVYIVRAYENGRQVQQCQLESSAVATQMGTAALVGFQRGNTHHTTRTGFAQMPSYEQARPVLVDLMGRLLRGENVESGASSTPR